MAQIGEPPEVAVADARADPPTPRKVSVPRPSELDLELQPSIAAGRRARYSAKIVNRSSQAIEVQLSVSADGDRLRPLIVPASMSIAAGATRAADVLLRPRRPQLLRREQQHDAHVRVRSSDGAEAISRRVIFVQQRALPAWLLALLVPLAAGIAFGLTLLPHDATVPPVEGAPDVATAERALRSAGLRLDPRLRSRTTTTAKPGTVIDQIPAPGTRVERGERVTLLLAVGERRAVTPSLDGQSPARAAEILQAAGLIAGPVLPEGSPERSLVASQLPAAGSRVPSGTAVTVFVRALRPGESAGAPAAASSRGSATTKIPEIDGRDVAAYARAVAANGLVPQVVRTVGKQPIGTLVAVQPRPGLLASSGDRVQLLVSAGVPQLAYDTGDVLKLFDPRLGRTVRQASPPQGKAIEPSWSPDGRRVLYRVGRRLLLVSARLGDRGRVVYAGRTKYAAATFAPAPADNVVALVRRTGGDGDLCFGRVGQAKLRPRCSADPRWDLGRQISWRRGGRELLVFGVRRGQPERFGILRYRSSRAFSANPADWRGELATDTTVRGRGVIGAAYSPSGSSVALVTNIGTPRFQLQLTAADSLRDLGGPALPLRACEVAWRPDGKELAIVQSDDDCGRAAGEIVRVDPKRPRATTTVSSGGRHPAYQPLTYAGPKGVS